MSDSEAIARMRAQAEALYASGEYYCGEAIFLAANELLGRPVPDEMMRLASGFSIGMGRAGCACGALTGGVLALGLRYGRTEGGVPMPETLDAAKELHDRFVARNGSTCCRVLIRPYVFASDEHIRHCVALTGGVAEDVAELLLR